MTAGILDSLKPRDAPALPLATSSTLDVLWAVLFDWWSIGRLWRQADALLASLGSAASPIVGCAHKKSGCRGCDAGRSAACALGTIKLYGLRRRHTIQHDARGVAQSRLKRDLLETGKRQVSTVIGPARNDSGAILGDGLEHSKGCFTLCLDKRPYFLS
jgi:hypothetical protein